MSLEGYVTVNEWEHADARLRALERTYDPGTIRRLTALGVGPGWHCLEVGAGGGSVTRWLCHQVGPQGRVVAVDIDPRFLADLSEENLEIQCLDITSVPLPERHFDLIHVRAVLMHLPDRDRILQDLVAHLWPGGVLLAEEGDVFPIEGLGAGLYTDVWARCVESLIKSGMAPRWPRRLPQDLEGLGLADVQAEIDVPMFPGGSPGTEFSRLTWTQLRDRILAGGVAPEHLDQAIVELDDPQRWFPGWAMVAAWGRRPTFIVSY